MRKLVYYVAVSLDGYITGPNGEFDFYPRAEDMAAWINERYPETVPTHLRAAAGMAVDTPNREYDTVIMGRGAYEPALSVGIVSPYKHLQQYIISSTLEPTDDPRVRIIDTDPIEFVRRLKNEEGKNIWLCGGATLAGTLLDEIDELIIKSYPVVAGAGLPMVIGNFNPTQFTVTQRQEFSNGARATWLSRTAPAPLR